MKILWIVVGVVSVILGIYIISRVFSKVKKQDIDGLPPDDRYPLW